MIDLSAYFEDKNETSLSLKGFKQQIISSSEEDFEKRVRLKAYDKCLVFLQNEDSLIYYLKVRGVCFQYSSTYTIKIDYFNIEQIFSDQKSYKFSVVISLTIADIQYNPPRKLNTSTRLAPERLELRKSHEFVLHLNYQECCGNASLQLPRNLPGGQE